MFFSERTKGRKGVDLDRGENLGRVRGGKTIVSVQCMKQYNVNRRKMRKGQGSEVAQQVKALVVNAWQPELNPWNLHKSCKNPDTVVGFWKAGSL